jgi:sugar-phosphate isomerases, RpiB/LacA/LacB family
MNIVIGADHHGFRAKAYIKQYVVGIADPIAWIDVGVDTDERADYPLFGHKACQMILQGHATHGILLCGTGIGMSIVANRYKGIYAGLAWNKYVAIASKQDDNTNVLVLPSDFISNEQAVQIINAWLAAHFKGGHYQTRIDMIDVK